jgi:hypothetical protein
MGRQMTEMLKGTLEGTVYALLVRIEQKGLVDVEKRPSEKGPRSGRIPWSSPRRSFRTTHRICGSTESGNG